MVAYAAVSYEAKGEPKPALGSVKIEADTRVAPSERLVDFSKLQITESNFPTLPKEQVREVVEEITKTIPAEGRVIALDRVLASVDKSQIVPRNVEGVKADPPAIFFSETPALLVNLDGEPIWSPIAENDLKFVVNTNWDLFEHGPTKTFYLRNEDAWLKAGDIKGPWSPAGKLPESFGKLPADANWKEVKAALPGKKIDPGKAPKVFVSTTPAEMILLTGAPQYQPVEGTSLVWLSNTESDVFRAGKVLLSRFPGPVDVRDPDPARRLPEDLPRAPALARAGFRSRNPAGRRGRAARPGPPDRARQQEGAQGARSRVPGRAEVPAD
jgi:hypothetical protein